MESRRYTLARDGQKFRLDVAAAEVPTPGPGEVLVRVGAVALNRRDIMVRQGFYPVNGADGFVPCSDAAGTVAAIGPDVTGVAVGDRVCSTFFQDWPDGRIGFSAFASALGAGGRGVLADHVILSAGGAVPVPAGWTDMEASTIPCAAVTAWSALKGVAAGDAVLILGTGGVALYAVQIAAAMGARPFIISSSDEKLARARALGAIDGVNYRTCPDWEGAVVQLTGGGVQRVVELGGAGTLARSLRATAVGGHVALVGALAGFGGEIAATDLTMGVKSIGAVAVGNRADHLAVSAFLSTHRIQPVIERVFDADAAEAAYAAADKGAFGKIVIRFA